MRAALRRVEGQMPRTSRRLNGHFLVIVDYGLLHLKARLP